MNVNYVTDSLGNVRWHFPGEEGPEVDRSTVKIGGIGFESAFVCLVTTSLLGTIRLAIECRRNWIQLRSFAVIKPPKGRAVTAALLERAAHELPGMVREAVVRYRLSVEWVDEPVDPKDVNEAVRVAMMPRRGSGETASEYVYRLWRAQYQPYGRTQKDLAKDLGRSYDLVREYVSNESRREREQPKSIADAITRKRRPVIQPREGGERS